MMEKTKLSIGDYNGRGEALVYDENDNLVAIVPDNKFAELMVDSLNEILNGCPSCHFNENKIN